MTGVTQAGLGSSGGSHLSWSVETRSPQPRIRTSSDRSDACLLSVNGSLGPVLIFHTPSLELLRNLLYILISDLKSRATDPFRWQALSSFPLLVLVVNQMLRKNIGGVFFLPV